MSSAPVEIAGDRPGLNVAIGAGEAPVVSDVWTMGGWTMQFVRLDPHQSFDLDQMHGTVHVKVITGRLVDIDRGAYPPPKVVQDTRVTGAQVTAGRDGAVFGIFTATPGSDAPVADIDALRFGGPFDEALQWQPFEARYHGLTSYFDGLDAHLAPGFHLLDEDRSEIAYVFVWAAGRGVDMSTHNHGRAPGPTTPAFAEVHLVLHNGTGSGGMYETAEPGAPTRDAIPDAAGRGARTVLRVRSRDRSAPSAGQWCRRLSLAQLGGGN